MAITKYLPLGFSDYWLGSSFVSTTAMLLRTDVTSIPETVTSIDDLNAYEIATGGGYTTGAYGVFGPTMNRVQDAATGVVEYNVGTSLWQSTTNLTVSFRWIVLCANAPLVVIDTGTTTTLTAQPLTVQLYPSANITGSYPILRFVRNTA